MQHLEQKNILDQNARLRRLAVAIVGDSLADDVLQDVWLAALAQSHVEPVRSSAWYSRVTLNLAWRKRIGDSRRRSREERNSVPEASDTLEAVVARIEEGHAVERTLLSLPEPFRKTLLWHYYEDLSITEISRRSGRPESTTRTHLQRGLERLRERLQSEHGGQWISALLPLLGSEHAAPVGVAGLGGLLMWMLSKPILILPVLLATWFGYESLAADESEPPAVVEPVTKAAQTETAKVETSETGVQEPEREAITPEEPVKKKTKTPKPAKLETTPVKVIDEGSKLGIPGLRVDVQWKKKTFKFTTGDQGELTLPFAIPRSKSGIIEVVDEVKRAGLFTTTGSSRKSIGAHLRPRALLSNSQPGISNLTVHVEEGREEIEFRLRARSAWVRLPVVPNELELKSLYATTQLNYGWMQEGAFQRYEPVLVRGADLLFMIPPAIVQHRGENELTDWTLNITVGPGRSYSATMPPFSNFSAPPQLAKPRVLVEQRVFIRSKRDNQPLVGASVSVYEFDNRRNNLAVGISDKLGQVTLSSLPPGKVRLISNFTGFEMFQGKALVEGGASSIDIELVELPGKSDLDLNIVMPAGPEPGFTAVAVLTLPLRNIQASMTVYLKESGSGSWEARVTIPEVPAGEFEVAVTTNRGGLATTTTVPVTMPSRPVEVALKAPPASAPLRVEFKEEVGKADFWIGGNGSFSKIASSFMSGVHVAQVTLERRPRVWLLAAEGYVPVFGHQDAWEKKLDPRGESEFVLAPRFEKGEAHVVRVVSMEIVDGRRPYWRGGKSVPLAQVVDATSGALLAETDVDGFALLRKLKAGAKLKILAEGFADMELTLDRGPFTHCDLVRD